MELDDKKSIKGMDATRNLFKDGVKVVAGIMFLATSNE